jgi:hypothetical protein
MMMPIDRGVRFASIRRRVLVMVAVMFVVPMAVFASASPAMAERPFEKFKGCPTEIPVVIECAYNVTSAGEFTINKTKVPINKPIVQQSGLVSAGNPEVPTLHVSIGAKAGFESFQKVALNVPGGLLGFVNCTEITGEGFFEKAAREACKFVFEHGPTEVTATTEPVANEKNPPLVNGHNLANETGTAVVLPVRIHLKNTFLGNGCYIGSEAHPIQLNLTTGTSGKLKGKFGSTSTIKEEIPGEEEPVRALNISGNSLVDNTFAVPVVEGCGEFLGIKGFLNGVINGKIGLPSVAGNNAANLEGELNSTSPAEVIRAGF